MPINELIKEFALKQIKALGYERYMVRSLIDKGKGTLLYWVEVYTRSGLVIKTKFSSLSDLELSSFIGCTMEQL